MLLHHAHHTQRRWAAAVPTIRATIRATVGGQLVSSSFVCVQRTFPRTKPPIQDGEHFAELLGARARGDPLPTLV